MISEPRSKLDYLLIYFELLSKIKYGDSYVNWTSQELERVSKQIREEREKLR